jgi:hypothetical protein
MPAATATLATSAGTLGATTLGFNALGIATTTLSHPAVDGAVAIGPFGRTDAASQARQCCRNSGRAALQQHLLQRRLRHGDAAARH